VDLHAVDRRHHDDHGVDRADRGVDVADEVRVAGGVEDVDLHAADLDRRERQRDADALADLLGVVVGDGVAVLDLAHPRDAAGREQHRFEERGLPRPAVAEEQDVADVGRFVGLHRSFR
jgi:hypothetical protein